jgi:ABC-type polysaccharide/polyol phosphate transport system ATPase subunit
MSEKTAIAINDIHKEFTLPQNKDTSLKQAAVNIVKRKNKVTQKVLDGVSFDIKKGEFFGIVGRNGSGKSTLLKLIAGVYYPTSGSIDIHGGLTPFIELGVGFNPELSGRDNVYLNGALLGFNRRQMDGMYEDIVEFAELGPFMDQKLKNYSSGMQVRLAFSIAVKAKNDILIFDEVLAVGDEAFQKKCMDVFHEYRRNKQTVVLVTHSMENVRSLCTRAMMLENGKIAKIGSVEEVADAYQRSNMIVDEKKKKKHPIDIYPKSLNVVGCKANYHVGDVMELSLNWPKELPVAWAGVAIVGAEGEYVFGSNTDKMHIVGNTLRHTINLNIGPGYYSVTALIKDADGNDIEVREKAAIFSIYDDFDVRVGGLARLKYDYKIDEKKS